MPVAWCVLAAGALLRLLAGHLVPAWEQVGAQRVVVQPVVGAVATAGGRAGAVVLSTNRGGVTRGGRSGRSAAVISL